MPSFKLLLAQIGVVLIAARLVGWLFRKLHQPRVIGEMLAGILLGPSLLGWVAPGLSGALFPPDSLGALGALSQTGLLLFMFLVGLELDLNQLRSLGRAAALTSQASIYTPFLLGGGLAFYLYPRLSDPSVNFISFTLFMGTAMSITAFPVLARILSERDMLRTKTGSLVITCAAIDDVTAWCLLAGITLTVRAANLSMPLWMTLVGLGGFVLVMLTVVKRALQSLASQYERQGELTQDRLAIILLVVLAAGWVTSALGVQALFGAFLAGAVMPRQPALVRELRLRMEALVSVLLLPLYFALTGLRASFLLISGAEMWWYCAIIIGLAVIGKVGGASLAARLTGLSWREAGAVGVLMNTRGLVELVILNIGLDLGILSPALFSMMVLMALVTTLMTTPLLNWVYPARLARE